MWGPTQGAAYPNDIAGAQQACVADAKGDQGDEQRGAHGDGAYGEAPPGDGFDVDDVQHEAAEGEQHQGCLEALAFAVEDAPHRGCVLCARGWGTKKKERGGGTDARGVPTQWLHP